MQQYVIRRLLLLIPVVVLVALVSFSLVHLTPGDPATFLLGPEATTEAAEELRERMGLNDPLYVQFFRWTGRAVQGDFGESLYSGEPVAAMIFGRLEPTLLLTFLSLCIALPVGLTTGIIMAIRRNSLTDQGLLVATLFGLAMPNFWLGINLILLLSVTFGLLPVAGYVALGDSPIETFKHLIMPAIALGLSQTALIARITRLSMLEVLNQDYIRTARAKGLQERRIQLVHALRNASIPILTIVGGVLATLLSGSIVIEVVFGLPGLGRLIVTAITRRDYPVIQGVILFIAVMYVLLNLIIDLLYVFLDPRIKLTD